MYTIGIFLFPVYQKWPRLRNMSPYAGLLIIAAALIAASFASKVWHLILTQGVLYALGGSMVYYPTMLFLDEWFIRRKGFAFGIMWVSSLLFTNRLPEATKSLKRQELVPLALSSPSS